MARETKRYGPFGFINLMATTVDSEGAAEGFTVDPHWVGVSWEGQPFPVQVRVGVWTDGTLACTGLKLGVRLDDELCADWRVTASALREVPVEQILVAYAENYRDTATVDPGKFPPELQRVHMPAFVAPKPRPGLKGHPDDVYADVARRYLDAKKVYPRGTYRELTRELNEESGERRAVQTVRRWVEKGLRVLKDRGEL